MSDSETLSAPSIPEISNREARRRVRLVRPVGVFLRGKWWNQYPHADVDVYHLKVPNNVRGLRELNIEDLGAVDRQELILAEVQRIRTLHKPGSAAQLFFPTIAEVLAQLPENRLNEIRDGHPDRIVAFHLRAISAGMDYERDESGYFHVAEVTLLRRMAD